MPILTSSAFIARPTPWGNRLQVVVSAYLLYLDDQLRGRALFRQYVFVRLHLERGLVFRTEAALDHRLVGHGKQGHERARHVRPVRLFVLLWVRLLNYG